MMMLMTSLAQASTVINLMCDFDRTNGLGPEQFSLHVSLDDIYNDRSDVYENFEVDNGRLEIEYSSSNGVIDIEIKGFIPESASLRLQNNNGRITGGGSGIHSFSSYKANCEILFHPMLHFP
jgi:hypothetical protein